MVQQSIEDGGGVDFVPGQDIRPGPYALVGCDDDGALHVSKLLGCK